MLRSLRSTLLAAVLMSLAGGAHAQQPASVTSYAELRGLLRTGAGEAEVLAQLKASPTQVRFVLGDEQVQELRQMRLSEDFIRELRGLVSPAVSPGDITDFAVILDCSGSMSDTLGGRSKMDVAKEAVRNLLTSIPDGRNLTFVVYGHDAERKCMAVDVVRPLSPLTAVDRNSLLGYVDQLRPAGNTPITRSLRMASEELSSHRGALSAMILITDGLETCLRADGTPEDAAAEAAAIARRIQLPRGLTVVSLGLKPEELAAIRRLSDATGGQTFDAHRPEQVARAIERIRVEQVAAAPPEPKAVNLAAASRGGRIVDASAEYGLGWFAKNLIDGGPAAYAAPSPAPTSVVIGFRDNLPGRIEAIGINPYSPEDQDRWVRKVRIEVSQSQPYTGYREIGTFDVPAVGDDHRFNLPQPVEGRFVRVTFLENGGSGLYMQCGEVMVYGTLRADASAPTLHENVAAAAAGGKVTRVTSEYGLGMVADNLIDGTPGKSWSSDSTAAQVVVLQLARRASIQAIAVNPYSTESSDRWVTEAEVFVSDSPEGAEWTSVGVLRITPVGQDHVLQLPQPLVARHVKLVFGRNGGSGLYIQAGEIKVLADR